MPDANSVPPTICPLCDKPNSCEAELDRDCWCVSTSIPAELIQQAEKIDPARSRCICRNCIDNAVNSQR